MKRAFANVFPGGRVPTRIFFAVWLAALAACPLPCASARPADNKQPQSRLRIEVTGGDDNKPVVQASVYIKFGKDPKSEKGKLTELNIKTNQEGIAQSPDVPRGKILIQIIAPGWKTYGEWHDITEEEQKIQIHLVRPSTKWY
jgi:hypothetical protein